MRTIALIAALAASAALPQAAAADPFEVGHIPQCLELVPAAVSLDSTPVTLSVLVLLDGVSEARARAILDRAGQAYGGLGLRLAMTSRVVSLSGTDSQGLIDQGRNAVGGRAPAGVDMVYVLTSKDIQADGRRTVAGQADCIGGVAFADRAFAVGEDPTWGEGSLLGLRTFADPSAKIAAHELGHLLGAHHHYANCAEGVATSLARTELAPCTLMFNELALQSLAFSGANATVVRGHAQLYAAP